MEVYRGMYVSSDEHSSYRCRNDVAVFNDDGCEHNSHVTRSCKSLNVDDIYQLLVLVVC